jgi:hypothetical protein
MVKLVTAYALPLWVVYDHPSDYPNCFVARLWNLYGERTDRVLTAATLDALRGDIQHATDFVLVRLDRQPNDDANIIETWL